MVVILTYSSAKRQKNIIVGLLIFHNNICNSLFESDLRLYMSELIRKKAEKSKVPGRSGLDDIDDFLQNDSLRRRIKSTTFQRTSEWYNLEPEP